MIQNKLVSVLVPSFNSEEDVISLLDKLLEQTYQNFEVIIVDDGSTKPLQLTKNYRFSTKVIRHENNCGLFEARRTGFKNCRGDLILFVDSDDSISCDWIRSLVQKQEETNADIVFGDFLLEKNDGYFYYPRTELWQTTFQLSSKELSCKVIFQEGLDYSWHVVWNKLYDRALVGKVYESIPSCSEKKLVMCEDILFSVISFFYAEKAVNTHNNYYYYNKKFLNTSTSDNSSFDRIEKNVDDIDFVFKIIKKVLKNHLSQDQIEKLNRWRDRIFVIWIREARRKFSFGRYKERIKKLSSRLTKPEIPAPHPEDYYFYYEEKFDFFDYEDIKKQIIQSEVVTFDVFDTLVLRPFWEPSDLFVLLDKRAREILGLTDVVEFSTLRKEAEVLAREKAFRQYRRNEIKLNEIYDCLSKDFGFDRSKLQQLEQFEIELEEEFCYPRKSGVELFELANYLEKEIYIISDMYLPSEVVRKIINKVGVSRGDLKLSSDNFLTKSSGTAFSFLKDIGVPLEKILHIGDNFDFDFKKPQELGLKSALLPKTVDVFRGAYSDLYTGRVYKKIYEQGFDFIDSRQSINFFGIRCQLAIVANEFFDNPFRSNNRSDFLSSHIFAGAMCLGMLNLGICVWIKDKIKKQHYSALNFVARDGWLTMRCFELLRDFLNCNLKINYFPVSRKALLPFFLKNKGDQLTIIDNLKVKNFRLSEILTFFGNSIEQEGRQKLSDFMKVEGLSEKAFLTRKQAVKVLSLLKPFAELPQEKKDIFKKFFSQFFSDNSASFDVGYSCRNEFILKEVFGIENLNCLYLHLNNQIPLKRAEIGNVTIEEYYNFTPYVKGTIRELLLSEVAPSCTSYTISKDNVIPNYEEMNLSVCQQIALNLMHEGCFSFVKTFLKHFSNYPEELQYMRTFECSYPFEYYLNESSLIDRWNFGIFDFEDDFEKNKRINLIEIWQEQMPKLSVCKPDQRNEFASTNKYAKALYWYLVDKSVFKEKIKRHITNDKVYFMARWINKVFLKI